MYLYFDRKGTLLEMVNDEALRRYNKNINYVYVYMENEEDQNEFVDGLSYLTYHFKKPDGKLTIEYSTETHEGDEKLYGDENGVIIPVDVKRDLKHFRYGVKYAMHKILIPSGNAYFYKDLNGNGKIDENEILTFEDNIFEYEGPVEMSIRAHFLDGSIYTLGKVVFTIEHAVIKTTQGITLSQFDYLLKRVNEVEKMEGPAAGFGEPTAIVTTLPTSSDASVNVTATGENKAKVFNFEFGIPKGEQGIQGPKGDTGEQGPQGPEGPQGEVGKGFSIEKVYISVEEMESDFDNTDVPFNSFVLIDTGDVEDEENSRLYVKLESGFSYLTDLSGSQGIQGPQGPIGPQGQRGKEGLSVYIYNGILTETTTTITDKTQILLPSDRTLHEGDILLSSLEGYVGAMAKIESVTENEIVVVYIGVLEVQTEGGITDVQVDGTSVVEDGVANIPAASDTKAGVVTTGAQTFAGNKNFTGYTYFGRGSSRYTVRGEGTNGMQFYRTENISGTKYVFAEKSNLNNNITLGAESSYISISWGGTRTHLINFDKSNSNSGTTQSNLPLYTGTLMSAPETWTTGTSGSAYLPQETGIFEIAFQAPQGMNADACAVFVQWDETLARSSVLIGDSSFYYVEVDSQGNIRLYEEELGNGRQELITTVRYRKLGIA